MAGFGGGNMQNLMKQAQKMQEEMQKTSELLDDWEIVGTSASEAVVVYMNAKKLSNRLALAADFVTENAAVADIGTDHGSLPIFLVSSGKCPKAIASDLRKGPLASAESNIKTAGLSNVIETRLSDGLKSIKKDEFDEAVMAGMGGILIAKLLERTDWVKNKNIRLILQPMSHAEEVRLFLCNNGFDIIEERTCRDDGRIYSVICAEYSGKIEAFPQGYEFYGKLDPNDDIARKLVERQHKRLKIRASSLREANFKLDEAEYCEKACLGMESFLNGGEK